MNSKLFETLINWPRAYISGTDFQCILNKSPDSRHSIIKRAIQKGYLIPIRRDLYLIKNLGKPLIDSFELAQLIYGPSFISLESALEYHRLIPEAVYTITSVTIKRSKNFSTPLGLFSYTKIPTSPAFFACVERVHYDKVSYFMAKPWRALADIIYLRNKKWQNLDAICEDMRIEKESLIITTDLSILAENYPSKKTREILQNILRQKNEH